MYGMYVDTNILYYIWYIVAHLTAGVDVTVSVFTKWSCLAWIRGLPRGAAAGSEASCSNSSAAAAVAQEFLVCQIFFDAACVHTQPEAASGCVTCVHGAMSTGSVCCRGAGVDWMSSLVPFGSWEVQLQPA